MQVPIVIKEALDVYGYPSTFGWNYTSYAAGGVDLFPLQNAVVRTISHASLAVVSLRMHKKAHVHCLLKCMPDLTSARQGQSWAAVTRPG
jgi:hypothetical protein